MPHPHPTPPLGPRPLPPPSFDEQGLRQELAEYYLENRRQPGDPILVPDLQFTHSISQQCVRSVKLRISDPFIAGCQVVPMYPVLCDHTHVGHVPTHVLCTHVLCTHVLCTHVLCTHVLCTHVPMYPCTHALCTSRTEQLRREELARVRFKVKVLLNNSEVSDTKERSVCMYMALYIGGMSSLQT